MRVLLVSNHHGSLAGGAVTMLARTQELLEGAGHETITFALREDANPPSPWRPYFPTVGALRRQGLATRAGASPYSLPARARITRLVRAVRPEVAHLHNVFGKLTLSIVDALHAESVPVVLTLHEFRSVCPNGLLYTHDGICHRCLHGRRFRNAVVHRCEGSLYASAIAAAEAYLNHRRDVWRKVDAFVAPSEFLADVVVAAGLPAERVHVLPNPAAPLDALERDPDEPPSFVYSGRLMPEKGLDVLVDALRLMHGKARVDVYGEGPVEPALRERVESEGLPIEIHGYTSKDVIAAALDRCLACVMPSLWYENCPMAILEASARGVATVTSDVGGMAELVLHKETGLCVPPGEPEALAGALDELVEHPAWALELGRAAWHRVRERHDPGAHLERLLALYDAVA